MIADKLSHYRIVEKIGAGGMGVVYRAHDEQLGRDVALKVLPAGTLANEDDRRRFRREAMAMAKLNQPTIGAIDEFGQEDGVDFLAMELVSGVGIEARIALGALPEREVLRLGIQLADGLEAAHAQGIVHRDLKPGNLRLTSDGRLKILDFGLAHWSQPDELAAVTVTLTKSQEISGTLPYMAPEQLRGQTADERSDIYSAGAVLYEMSTARRPFPEVAGPQLVGAILERTPSPASAHNHRISSGLESILSKTLDKQPERRYQAARELRVDLERLSSGILPVQQQRARWKWAASSVIFLTLIILAVLNVGGWRERLMPRATSSKPAAANARRSVAVLGFKNLSGNPDEAWISTALSEMLTTELAAGEQLRTVPGENVAQMKADLALKEDDSFGSDTLEKIHKRLGSDLVVLGSYLAMGKEAGGKIRLDFRLQDAVAGQTIASITESGTEGELLELISQSGASLRQKLSVGSVSEAQASDIRAALPANPEAARFYSEGLAKLRVFEAQDARDLLQKAVAADARHAPSHAALAAAWSLLGYDGKAQEEAKQAFNLSANLSREQRLSIEGGYHELQRDWVKAIEIYRTLWGFFPDNLDYGLRLAGAQIASGGGEDALATVAAMRNLPPPESEDARVDLIEARAADSVGDFKRTQSQAAESVRKGRAMGAGRMVAQALLIEGGALQHQGLQDQAGAAFSEAQQLFTVAGDRQGAAIALQSSGGLLYDKGDYESARQIYEQALIVFHQIGAERNVSGALNRIGNALYDENRLTEAKAYYEQTLDLDRKIGDKQGIAGSLGNIANVLDGMGDLRGSLKMQEAGLQAFTDVGNKRGMASTITNMANVLEEMGDLENAKKRFEQSAQMQHEASHRRGEGYAIYGIGDVLMAQGKLAEARKRQEEALRIRQEIGETGTAAQSQAQLAMLALEEGHPSISEDLARQAATVFEKDKSLALQATAYSILSRALLAQKKLPEAESFAGKAVELSLKNPDRTSRFEATLAKALVLAEKNRLVDANKLVSSVLAEARKFGYLSYELQASLITAEIEVSSGKAAAGKARLQALEQQASAKGFNLVAQKASKLLG
jgi:eukaryotic-like serine/threonine-protein kinase